MIKLSRKQKQILKEKQRLHIEQLIKKIHYSFVNENELNLSIEAFIEKNISLKELQL